MELAKLIKLFTTKDGITATSIPSLNLVRASSVSEPLPTIYKPSLYLIAQGSKIVMLAKESYRYDPTCYLVSSVHLPISGQIIEATPECPYLCISLSFEINEILDIIKESNQELGVTVDSSRGLFLSKTYPALLEAVLRLISLLATQKDIPVLSPLIIHEILYRILQDEQGYLIKQFAKIGSHSQRIAKVIHQINSDFSKPLRIDELASLVNMSTSSLHNHFKKITVMSPLQYQKRIRLQEARRLLLSDTTDAADAGFKVGYESPSQFSREYSRMFGLPPISDIKRLRGSLTVFTD